MPLASTSVLESLSANSDSARLWKPTIARAHNLHSTLRVIKSKGARVTENIDPAFGGGVAYPGHSVDGAHYVILWCQYHSRHHSYAADINYGVTGPAEHPMLDAAAAYAIIRGMRVLSGPGVPQHENHAHIDYTPMTRSNVVFWNPRNLAWPGNDYPVTFSATLRKGHANADVKRMQNMLAFLGYSLMTDGSFGPGTQRTVRAFQERYDLKVDGVAGPATLTKLVAVFCYKKIGK